MANIVVIGVYLIVDTRTKFTCGLGDIIDLRLSHFIPRVTRLDTTRRAKNACRGESTERVLRFTPPRSFRLCYNDRTPPATSITQDIYVYVSQRANTTLPERVLL